MGREDSDLSNTRIGWSAIGALTEKGVNDETFDSSASASGQQPLGIEPRRGKGSMPMWDMDPEHTHQFPDAQTK